MNALLQLFADARGHREEAKRARKVAETASGQLQIELLAIATLYDLLADGKDPTKMSADQDLWGQLRHGNRPLGDANSWTGKSGQMTPR